jgi:hypothetical protein
MITVVVEVGPECQCKVVTQYTVPIASGATRTTSTYSGPLDSLRMIVTSSRGGGIRSDMAISWHYGKPPLPDAEDQRSGGPSRSDAGGHEIVADLSATPVPRAQRRCNRGLTHRDAICRTVLRTYSTFAPDLPTLGLTISISFSGGGRPPCWTWL